MGPNKIACIGGGYWGKNLIRNFSDLEVLAWICEIDSDRRARLGATYPTARLTDDVHQVLADPEVAGVVIATPAETHGELVREALLAGKDVFVEKPLCLSVEEGQQLVGCTVASWPAVQGSGAGEGSFLQAEAHLVTQCVP